MSYGDICEDFDAFAWLSISLDAQGFCPENSSQFFELIVVARFVP
jgi:hypothetical protein